MCVFFLILSLKGPLKTPQGTRAPEAAARTAAAHAPPMPKARPVQASGSAVCDVRAGSNAGDVSKRGWELASNGDLRGGLACHEAATALPSAGALNWFHRARTEQEAGMHVQAMSSYERAVNAVETRLRSTEALESYFQLGKLRRDHGDFGAAERAYREVLKLGPDRSGAHIMLGVTLRDAERLGESVHHYSVGLRLHPGIPAAQYNRAQIYSQLSREEEAIHSYRVAVRTEPTFALAQEVLGETLGARGRLAEAVSALGLVRVRVGVRVGVGVRVRVKVGVGVRVRAGVRVRVTVMRLGR